MEGGRKSDGEDKVQKNKLWEEKMFGVIDGCGWDTQDMEQKVSLALRE